ncbi:MAG: hypothetical protein R3C49_20370 [Planctomycetaceae bacterium]
MQDISYRLAAAANGSRFTFFSLVDRNGGVASDGPQQLDSGEYRIFVRGVNDAHDADGNWIGRGPWSRGVDFSFRQIEGADAAPKNLTATSSLRPTVSWDPEGAEAYLINLWKGPEYSRHQPVILRVQGTSWTPQGTVLQSWRDGWAFKETIEPGDEFYIKVRALGQDGSPINFEPGNHASTTVVIPRTLGAEDVPAPRILGPATRTSDSWPVLRWEDVGNATSYDVWFSSLETGQRLFMAEGVEQNALYLAPRSHDGASWYRYFRDLFNNPVYAWDTGLAEGRYRFWVRGRNDATQTVGAWGSGYEFEVDHAGMQSLNLIEADNPTAQPLAAPNLVLPYEQDGRRFVLVTNGKGESYGASVLARFEVADDGTLFRPVVTSEDGTTTLEFRDLRVGSNVAAMKAMPDGRIIILSRGSGELYLVNPEEWSARRHTIDPDPDMEELPDASGVDGLLDVINMEILDNGQIVVVFNRMDRLRIFEVTENGFPVPNIVEVPVYSTPNTIGLELPDGRGVQVSGVPLDDGTFRLFVATPGANAVVAYDYDYDSKTASGWLVPVNGSSIFRRSRTSNPFHGGTTKNLTDAAGETQTFYFSADRQGFLTWINAETLQSGFVDLADSLPDVSRDPNSDNYADPDENTFDPTRIISVDADHIAVFNNRQSSVLLKTELQSDGTIHIGGSAVLPPSYGGAVLTLPSGLRIIGTGTTPFSRNHLSNRLAVSRLEFDDAQQTWNVTGSTSTRLATPAVFAVALGEDLVVEYAEGMRSVVSSGDDGELHETRLPVHWVGLTGNPYFLTNDATAAYVDRATGRRFLIVTALPGDGPVDEFAVPSTNRDDRQLLVIDITDPLNAQLFAEYSIGQLRQVRSATASSDRIVLLDRQGGEMLTVSGWQTPDVATFQHYQFHARTSEMGRTRPAAVVILPDGTTAVMHDTTPDRGVSVFPAASTGAADTSVFHVNNTGSFAFDLHVLDEDRITAVTYAGHFIVLNLRTGVIEADQPLNDADGTTINARATENSSYGSGRLLVNTPATQTVAEFAVEQTAGGFLAVPNRIFELPAAVVTVPASTGYWIVETDTVHRVRY